MIAEQLASGLGFAEGPIILETGRLVFCDGNTGELLTYERGSVRPYARTGGSPWGAALGSDGCIYVTQGGGVPGSDEPKARSGIQRISPGGPVEMIADAIGGEALYGPNDLAFGPDDALYFTESGSEYDDRFEERAPGRLYKLRRSGGNLLLERPAVYPNGIAFGPDGLLYWTESKAHRVCRLEAGRAVVFAEFSTAARPDGVAFAADGTLFVAGAPSECVAVVSGEGQTIDEIHIGVGATNCCFDRSTLFVTATEARDIEVSARTGSLWKVETGRPGLPLLRGKI